MRDSLVEEYARLVKYIAYRLTVRLPSHVNVNDLISAGMIGLREAIDRFDPNRGGKLETFAYLRVKRAMLDELRAMDWVAPYIRQKSRQLQDIYTTLEARLGRPPSEDETAHALGISMEEYQTLLYKVQGLAVISLEDLGISKGEKEEDYLDCLQDTSEGGSEVNTSFKEIKRILSQFIDILPEKEKIVLSLYYYDELTPKEIGDVIGLTEFRICQLHAQAILRLKGKLRTVVKR